MNKFTILKNWKPICTLENVLTGLKNEMASGTNKGLKQPPDG